MKTMKHLWICLCLLGLLPLSLQAQEEKLSADSLSVAAALSYASGDYEQAAACYEHLRAEFGQSYQLYYNLGNAYFKAGQYPQATLNYEKAKLLNPRDADLLFNLELCQSHVVDKIEPLGQVLFVRLYQDLLKTCSANAWAVISLAAFGVFILCLALYFFGKTTVLKKLSFSFGIISILITIFTLTNAAQLYSAYIHPKEAIVFAPTVTVKSSPDQSGTELFVLHEGTKLKVNSRLGSWVEVEIADGSVGWMPATCIEMIKL